MSKLMVSHFMAETSFELAQPFRDKYQKAQVYL